METESFTNEEQTKNAWNDSIKETLEVNKLSDAIYKIKNTVIQINNNIPNYNKKKTIKTTTKDFWRNLKGNHPWSSLPNS